MIKSLRALRKLCAFALKNSLCPIFQCGWKYQHGAAML